jgi:ATP-dependent helicase/nuclease subunit A
MKHLSNPAWNFSDKDKQETAAQILAILKDPDFGPLFGPDARPEVAITGIFERNGRKELMSGQIDRLVVDDNAVTIVDFKNSRKVPATVEDVPDKYMAQMAAYRLALAEIYPDKDIRCALLWTRQAKLMPLPNAALDKALADIGLKPNEAAKKPQGPAGGRR